MIRRMTVLIGLVVLVFSARAQITSNFSTDADGWAIGDLSGGSAQTITYSSSGGNPGGYISLTTGNPNPFYWFAPAKFLGNRAYTSFGEALTFDVRTTATAIDHTGSGDIMIINNSNVSIYANFTVLPGAPGTWTTMSIMLDETGNWKNSNISGSAASRAQVIDVLTSIQAIRINFAWKAYPTNGITGSLDNVVMGTHPATPPAPSITSLSAKAAVRGTNITITGSNFGANATSNVVWFGDVKGNIVTASSTSITVTVPVAADYAPIMVLNTTTQLSTLSRQKFAPTFPSNGGGQLYKGSFLSDIVYNRSVGYISHGDLNGDGKPEMFASQGTQISIYENVSTPGSITTSSFATRIDLNPTLAAGYYEIHNDDLDGDGKPDVFFALRDNPDQGRVGVLRNIHTSGPISAASFDTYQEYNFPVYTAVTAMSADLDGDGKPEILGWGGSCAPSPLYILQNISVVGEIRFTSAYSITGATSCQGRFEVADLDGDGKLDVVQSTGNETRIFRNLSVPGTISFAAGFDMGNGGNIASIGDLDNDGKPEIVYANGGMKIFKNVSTAGTLTSASFQGPTIFANGTNVAKIADVNGDGKPDVVVGGGSAMGVYQNVTPDGVINTSSFLPIVPIDVTNLPTEIDVFDVDADGYPDVVSNSANLIQINRNTVTIAPTITNINPKSGTPGSTLTITGTNFSTVATDNTLYFGAAKATVTNATSTSLTVTVPLGATFDQISLSLRGYNVFSPQFFTPTFSGGSPFAASSMAAPFDITNGTTSTGLSVMDYDGDGKVDVLVDNAGSVNALRNIGNTGVIDATTFAAPYAVTNQGQAIRGVDIDGDGKLDLTTPGYIWRNISNPALPNPIAFDASVTRDGSTVTRFAPPRDLNGDGRVDMIYTTSGTNITYVQNESRAGGFAANSTTMSSFLSIVTQPKPSSGGYCAAADFDGDGFNDLVATNPNTDNFSAFISAGQTGNLTTASFSAGKLFAAGDVPAGLAVLDFDGDGKLDVAIANSVNSSTTTISLYRNVSTIGSIDFQRQDFQAALGPTDIVAADIDGDGKPDLVTTNVNSNSFSIFRNTSTTGVINTSSFAAKVDYPIASQPRGLSVADIDNDTRPDIIVTRATNIVSIFKNLVPLGPIISFSQQPVNKTACENGTVTFSVAATGASNLTYNWQLFNSGTGSFSDLSANANYSGVNTATLTVTAITAGMNGNIYRCRVNGTGASEKNSDQATLTTSVSPSPPLTSGATSCKGSSLTLTAGGSIDGNYRWFDSPTASQPINGEVNSNFATPVIFSTTTFYAAIANANGCLSTKTAAVATIAPLTKPAISSNGTLLCGVNVVTIKGPAGFSTYNWSNGESTQNIDVSFTGSYSLIVQDANGCQSLASDAITITAGSVPKPVIDANKTRLCSAGDQVILTAPAGFSAYEWSNGETTQTLVVTDAGTFNVRVTNSSGCRSETSDDITVDLGAEKPSISVGKNVLVSTPAKTYQWSYGEIAIPGATSQFLDYNPFQYGTYAVSVTDFSDCAATSDVFVNLVTAVEDEIVQAVVYPNPFIDVIELDADEAQLLDATGKHVQHLQRGKNDASQLSRGLYIVITGSKKIKISK